MTKRSDASTQSRWEQLVRAPDALLTTGVAPVVSSMPPYAATPKIDFRAEGREFYAAVLPAGTGKSTFVSSLNAVNSDFSGEDLMVVDVDDIPRDKDFDDWNHLWLTNAERDQAFAGWEPWTCYNWHIACLYRHGIDQLKAKRMLFLLHAPETADLLGIPIVFGARLTEADMEKVIKERGKIDPWMADITRRNQEGMKHLPRMKREDIFGALRHWMSEYFVGAVGFKGS